MKERHGFEVNPDEGVHSPYFKRAIKLLNKELEKDGNLAVNIEHKRVGEAILRSVDEEGVKNFYQFELDKFPGVKFPVTEVDPARILEIAGVKVPVNSNDETQDGEGGVGRRVYFVFPGWGANPFTAWDMIYDRIIGFLPETMRNLKKGEIGPRVVVLGYPNSEFGQVNDRWNKCILSQGFDCYGEVFADLLRSRRDRDSAKWIVFHGMSMGASVAKETYKNLPESTRAKTQLLLDNPAAAHDIRGVPIKFLQIPFGFILEGKLRTKFDPEVSGNTIDEKESLLGIGHKLREKGVLWVKDENIWSKRWQSLIIDIWNLIKGDLDPDMEAYVRRGLYDPVSFNPFEFMKRIEIYRSQGIEIIAKGRSRDYPIRASHFINRYRVEKWARIINSLSNDYK